jgi:hypothetical protein
MIWKVSLLVLWQAELLVPNSATRVPDLEGELAGPVVGWTVPIQPQEKVPDLEVELAGPVGGWTVSSQFSH